MPRTPPRRRPPSRPTRTSSGPCRARRSSPSRPSSGPGTWRIDVYATEGGLSEVGQQLVSDIRATPAPYPTEVGGLSASFVDQKDSLAAHLPWAILLIAATTIIALFIMTGSVILPIKAVIMNLLTLGATLGILVYVFQDGRLESLLGYDSVGALDLTQPILLGAMAFGLSTDYAVFLLSRIKEAHDAGADTKDAVALGLQRTGRIVTAAALLFAIAIGAFATSQITLIKELGVGTALAVLIDATIIRALLVPSLMALFGDWNWWAPAPLRRLHRRIGFSESEPEPRRPESEPVAGLTRPVHTLAGPLAPGEGSRQQAPLAGAGDRVLAGGHAQLAVDRPHLGLHRVVGDVEVGGDLARRAVAREAAQHGELALGQVAASASAAGAAPSAARRSSTSPASRSRLAAPTAPSSSARRLVDARAGGVRRRRRPGRRSPRTRSAWAVSVGERPRRARLTARSASSRAAAWSPRRASACASAACAPAAWGYSAWRSSLASSIASRARRSARSRSPRSMSQAARWLSATTATGRAPARVGRRRRTSSRIGYDSSCSLLA